MRAVGEDRSRPASAPPCRSRWQPRPDIVVQASALPEWVRRWGQLSGRVTRLWPQDAVTVAGAAGETVVLPRGELILDPPLRIMVAVRSLPDDVPVLSEAVDLAVHFGGSLRVLHGVPLSFGERSVGMAEALRRGRGLLSEVADLLRAAGIVVPVQAELVRAWPHEFVGERLGGDLLVVGGMRRGCPEGIGLVGACAVQHARCPVVLAARPPAPWARGGWSAVAGTPVRSATVGRADQPTASVTA